MMFKVTLYHGKQIVDTNGGATLATFTTEPIGKTEAVGVEAGMSIEMKREGVILKRTSTNA